jgi:hypothetical protein
MTADISAETCVFKAEVSRANGNSGTASLILALRAALDRAEADKAAAVEAMREAAKACLPTHWFHAPVYHNSAIAALNALAPPPAARGQDVDALVQSAESFLAFFDKAMEGFTSGYADRQTAGNKEIFGWNDARLTFQQFADIRAALAPFTGGGK